MDMKLESVSDLYLIRSVLVPGFVYNGILAHFIPFRMSSEKALIVLRLLTATAVNYAICSPLLFALITGSVFPGRPWAQAAIWFVVLFGCSSGDGSSAGNHHHERYWVQSV